MQVIPTAIPDVLIIEPEIFADERGFFFESWNEGAFREAGIKARFVQDNHSRSAQNVVRGLHYQIKQPQGKLIRAIAGEVFDVVVDIRRSSPTFGKWVGTKLSGEDRHMLWVPPGFAHGFVVLSEYAEFLYKTTDYYSPEYERTILWNDSNLAISWPISGEPLLSAKDQAGTPFKQAEVFP